MPNDINTSKMFTRGGQITFNNLRMLMQIYQKVFNWSVGITILMTVTSTCYLTSAETLKATYYYVLASVLMKCGMTNHLFSFTWHGKLITVDVISLLAEPYFNRQADVFIHYLKVSFLGSILFSAVFTLWVCVWLIGRGKKQAEKRHLRGARLDSPRNVSKAIRKYGGSDISIESIPMVENFEVRHTLIHGTIGSGKGQTFNQFLEGIRKRGDSAIVFDKGCVFTGLFHNQDTDVILNPFDKRCASWDLWQEARTEPDFENIAASLIPKHGDSDPYWVDAARTVFSSTAYAMRRDPERSMDKLLALILTAELDVLSDYLKGTQASTLVSDKIEKTAISIRSVISTYLKSLRFLKGLDSNDVFSIRDWISSISQSNKGHFLFISSNAEQHAALRPLISMWLSMASITLLSLNEDYNRRIWFICDELPTLHKLPQLGETIAEVRKFGGCFVLGMQSFSQLQKVYGRAEAAELFDLLNTRFFFRSPSADMAAVVSKEIGFEDIEQSSESYSYGAATVRDGISIGTQRVSRPLVSAAEIMELPDLTAYLRVPAPVPVTKVDIKYRKRDRVSDDFLPRDNDDSDMIGNDDVSAPVTSTEDPRVHTTLSAKNKADEVIDISPPQGEKSKEAVCAVTSMQHREEEIVPDLKNKAEFEHFF